MCPVERARDRSGCRASGLTNERRAGSAVVGSAVVGSAVAGSAVVGSAVVGSAVAGSAVAVPPLLVPPLLRLQALVPMVQRQPHRVCYFLDCTRKFRLRPPWWLKKAPDFTSVGHRTVQSTLLLSLFCSTGGIQARTFIRRIHHNEDKTHFNCSRHNSSSMYVLEDRTIS